MNSIGRVLVVLLTVISLFTDFIPPAVAQADRARIDLVVVSGEGAVNRLREHVSQDPVVRIEDQNHQPVAGAIVTFNVPLAGASGAFANGAKNLSVMTDVDGTAVGRNLRTNDIPGRLQILITASYRGLAARGLINQTNEGTPLTKGSGGHGKIVAILVVVGAAAAGGAFAASRSKGNSSPSGTPSAPPPIGITPGTGTVSHP